MDDLDKYISKIVGKKIYVPKKYEETIENALFKEKKTSSIFKRIASIIISILAIGGVAFAIQKTGEFYKNKDINEKDINVSEYVQNLNTEYQTKDNLSIKIDSILLDDRKIELIIEYLYNDSITSAESKILITDENNNIIYEEYELIDYYKNIFNIKNRKDFLEYKNINNEVTTDIVEDNRESEIFTARCMSNYINIESNKIKRRIKLYSNFKTKQFPRSKKMYIQLQDIVLKNGKSKLKEIKEKMIFEITLDKKYTDLRKTEIYKEINIQSNHREFFIKRAELSNTQLLLEIKYNGIQDISTLNLDSIQIWNEIDKEYVNAEGLEILEDNMIFVNFDINSKIFLDNIKGKIDYQEFDLQKSK